jgi:hypothetical protein
MMVDIAETNVSDTSRKRGRPLKDWTARSMLVMPLPLAFMQNIIERPHRDADVIGRWLGTHGRREPMKEIAERYNVTSERCRQIVKRFGYDVLGGDKGIEAFLSSCRDATVEGPIPLDRLRTRKAFEGISTMPMILAHMLDVIRMIHPDRALPEIIRDRSGMVLLPTDKVTWDRALVMARRMVRLAEPGAVSGRLAGLLPHMSELHRNALIELAKAAGGPTGIEIGDIREGVRILLEDSAEPVTVSDIARKMEELTGTHPAENYVRNTASAVGVRIGRGLYTSEKNLGLTKDDCQAVIRIVLDAMAREPHDRQWRPSEFLDEIVTARADLPQINAEIVSYLLGGCDNVMAAGRMVFKLKTAASGS